MVFFLFLSDLCKGTKVAFLLPVRSSAAAFLENEYHSYKFCLSLSYYGLNE